MDSTVEEGRGGASNLGRGRWNVLILAIETATERIGVAIIGSEGVRASFEAVRGRHHAEIVVPAIEFVCRHGGVTVEDLSAIAVDVGPGLFTGMRVGLATAKAMGLALGIPLVGITSLEVLAHSCRHSDKVIASVIDARKGQVFFGFHRVLRNGVEAVGEQRVGDVEDLIAAIRDRGQDVVCVGDGAMRYAADLESQHLVEIADRHACHPSVQNLAVLAMHRALKEKWSPPGEVGAVYLRPPDAEINWSTRSNTPAVEVAP